MDLSGLALYVPEGYRWVYPRAPVAIQIGSTPGWGWYAVDPRRAPFASEAETAAHVAESRREVGDFVTQLLTRLEVPRKRTLLMGFSQGAAVALHVGLASPESFAGIVFMSGYFPVPETLTGASGLAPGPILPQPILIVHGILDQVLPISLAREAKAWLVAEGLDPRYQEFPMDHQITPKSFGVVRDFMAEVLPLG